MEAIHSTSVLQTTVASSVDTKTALRSLITGTTPLGIVVVVVEDVEDVAAGSDVDVVDVEEDVVTTGTFLTVTYTLSDGSSVDFLLS